MGCYKTVIMADGNKVGRHTAVVKEEEERKEKQSHSTAAIESGNTRISPRVPLK
jgi:hypothetical protein